MPPRPIAEPFSPYLIPVAEAQWSGVVMSLNFNCNVRTSIVGRQEADGQQLVKGESEADGEGAGGQTRRIATTEAPTRCFDLISRPPLIGLASRALWRKLPSVAA